MRVKVNLDTGARVAKFVAITTQINKNVPVYLTGDEFKVSARSLMGAMCAIEWGEIWCECAEDIYTEIEEFVVIE